MFIAKKRGEELAIKADTTAPLWALSAATVFFALLDQAAGGFFYIFEGALLLTALALLLHLWQSCHLRPKGFLQQLKARLPLGGSLLILISAYAIADALSLLYTPALAYAMPKYLVVLGMGVLGMALVLSINNGGRITAFLWVLGGAGLSAGILSITNYLWIRLFPLAYSLRLSLRADYNVFATVVLLGLICSFFALCRSSLGPLTFCLAAGSCTIICVTVLLLSGSRRTVILLYPVLAVIVVLWLYRLFAHSGQAMGKMLLALLSLLIIVTEIYANVMFMGGYMQQQYAEFGEQGTATHGHSGETSLDQRYESIGDMSLFSKRLLIWDIALEELQTYTPVQWLVGKGAGYDILLYDQVNSPQLQAAYPDYKNLKGNLSAHNFILTDLLCGGILRAILGLGILVTLGILLLRLLSKSPVAGLLSTLGFGVILFNNSISNRYGLLYDKYFWLLAALLLAQLAAQAENALLGGDRR